MPDLTREQIEALATGRAIHAANVLIQWLPPGAQGWMDDLREIGYSADIIQALATDVLAQRERRCGTCRHHDTSHVDMSGRLACLRLGRSVAADWLCGDWAPKAGA